MLLSAYKFWLEVKVWFCIVLITHYYSFRDQGPIIRPKIITKAGQGWFHPHRHMTRTHWNGTEKRRGWASQATYITVLQVALWIKIIAEKTDVVFNLFTSFKNRSYHEFYIYSVFSKNSHRLYTFCPHKTNKTNLLWSPFS